MIASIISNFGGGPQIPSRIVVHAMGEFIAIDKNSGLDIPPGDYYAPDFLRVRGYSAHALITPSGVNIRCRNDQQGAYHAKGYNLDSLGIEFLVPGVHNYETFLKAIKKPYLTDAQYRSGVNQVKAWMRMYGITQIDRHSDLTSHKPDPGDGFPWDLFVTEVNT